jgi:hypothetical protein
MDTERRLITLPDGRDIDLLLAGPAGGLPLVTASGWPRTSPAPALTCWPAKAT